MGFHLPQGFAESQGLLLFTVNDANLLDFARDIPDVAAQFVLVGMTEKESIEAMRGPDFVRFAEDIHRIPAGQICAPRVCSAQ